MKTMRAAAILENLHQFQTFILQQAKESGLAAEVTTKLELVLEELVINVINYAYHHGTGDLEVESFRLKTADQQRFCVILRDWGVAFNPLECSAPVAGLQIEECPIGGLGVSIVQQMTNSLSYERDGNCNVLTVGFDF
ncbi:MAG: ATP-binding protein [Thermodesulfobacteriota bacterium]|nr:ATP-binding protein [Thermodesulfobacteriota bacterium]